MTDESHRDAMNDAIRAQRERGNVPKSMLPPEDTPLPPWRPPQPIALEPEPDPEPTPELEPAAKKSFLSRLLGR